MNNTTCDILIIGTGAAGLGLALSLASQAKITVLCKDDLLTSSSQQAQGGIAAVLSEKDNDSYTSHIEDTCIAGAGLCDQEVVEFVVRHAKPAIEWLINKGVEFTTSAPATYHLTQEGGHSHRRILHAADKTGAAVVKTLLQQVLDHQNINCLTEHTAIDLIVENNHCYGAHVLNNKDSDIFSIFANKTVIATGGASMAYLHTSNPNHATGDGIAMAWRAGARVANLEFNQFHPTCFYNPNGKTFLITEVMRGEGAILTLANGERFMQHYDQRAELAPRDIVSRAIHQELKTKNIDCVFLDISHEPEDKIKRLFPTIYKLCLAQGIDITTTPVPVVPAAHYTCGGIVTNEQGETDIERLYAIGETACTGLHGANRMASNSLLECLVFAKSAALAIEQSSLSTNHPAKSPAPTEGDINQDAAAKALAKQIRTLMWEQAGIVRSDAGLNQAKEKLGQLQETFDTLLNNAKLSKTLLECRNLLTNSLLMTSCALHRKESRGLHYNVDHPKKQDEAYNTVLSKDSNNTAIKVHNEKNIHDLFDNRHPAN